MLCSGLFQNMRDLDMSFVRHATGVKYVRDMSEMLHTDISSHSDIVNMSRCCLPHPICSFYLIQEADPWGRGVDFEVRQRLKVCSSDGTISGLFAVPPARQGLVYAA